MSAPAALPLALRPRVLALAGVALASLAGWAGLIALHGGAEPVPLGAPRFAVLCLTAPGPSALAWATAVWALMSVAMMLPTAAPAIDLYVRLTRRIERRRAAHVAGFAAGYVLAWGAFAAAAGAALTLAGRALGPALVTLPPALGAGALLLLAGLYQLSPLKAACLALCRSPLTFFMAHWREGVGGALAMGLRHGLTCIGCCWALMGLMLVAGTHDLAWMAALGLLMLAEKVLPGAPRWGRLLGLAMAAAGAGLVGAGVSALS